MSSKIGEIMNQLSKMEIGPAEEEEIRSGMEGILSNMTKVGNILAPILTQYFLDTRHGVTMTAGALFETLTDDNLTIVATNKKALLDAQYIERIRELTRVDFTTDQIVALLVARNKR